MTDMPRIYRVLGTDKHGVPVEIAKASEDSARRSVKEANRNAAEFGRPQDWRAEFADIERKALP
ncbi:hypothetical protein [Nocardia sp. NPDC060249]|uniref:hypothetical protein n=1 Tax=Nocardia sp. NPDC060249 TaxID=3347082 RepID=UPI00365D41CC